MRRADLYHLVMDACQRAGVEVRWDAELPFGVLGACELANREDVGSGHVISLAKGLAEQHRLPVFAHEAVHFVRGHVVLLWQAMRDVERGAADALWAQCVRTACEVWAVWLVPESLTDVLVDVPDPHAWERIAPALGLDASQAPPPEPVLARILYARASQQGEGQGGGFSLPEPDPHSPYWERRPEAMSRAGEAPAESVIEAIAQVEQVQRVLSETEGGKQLVPARYESDAGTGRGSGMAAPPLPPPPAWLVEVSSWLKKALRSCHSPHRRYPRLRMGDTRRHRTGDLPSEYVACRRKMVRSPLVLVVLDTSGSMLPDWVAQALSAIQQAAVAEGRLVHLRLCDTEVYWQGTISRGTAGKNMLKQAVDAYLREGGGGTDLRSGLENLPPDTDAVVIITDGFLLAPLDPPSVPACAVLPPDGAAGALPKGCHVIHAQS